MKKIFYSFLALLFIFICNSCKQSEVSILKHVYADIMMDGKGFPPVDDFNHKNLESYKLLSTNDAKALDEAVVKKEFKYWGPKGKNGRLIEWVTKGEYIVCDLDGDIYPCDVTGKRKQAKTMNMSNEADPSNSSKNQQE